MSGSQSWQSNQWSDQTQWSDWQDKPTDRTSWDSSQGTWGSYTWAKSGVSWQQDSVSDSTKALSGAVKQEVQVDSRAL